VRRSKDQEGKESFYIHKMHETYEPLKEQTTSRRAASEGADDEDETMKPLFCNSGGFGIFILAALKAH
jgi:hypothetical protein